MRIVSGTLKGKKLHSFQGKEIRPTSDRTREAIFNILSDRISGVVVLDLFAGSGALGIEALSRGAIRTTFIDNSPAALSLLKKNLRSCNLLECSRIILWDIERSLNCLRSQKPEFDLVFIDPPYHRDMLRLALTHLHNSRSLQPGACLVLEHGDGEKLSFSRPEFEFIDQRSYGKTLVSFLAYVI